MPTHQPWSTDRFLYCYFPRPYLTDETDQDQDAQKYVDAIEKENDIKREMSVKVKAFGQRQRASQQQHEKEMIELRKQAG